MHDATRLYLQDASHVQVIQSLSATPHPAIAKPPECEARRCNWGRHSLQKPDGAHRVLPGLVVAPAFDWNPVYDPRDHSGIHWIFSLSEEPSHQRAIPRLDRHHFWRDWTSGLGILLSHDDPRHDRRLACGPFCGQEENITLTDLDRIENLREPCCSFTGLLGICDKKVTNGHLRCQPLGLPTTKSCNNGVVRVTSKECTRLFANVLLKHHRVGSSDMPRCLDATPLCPCPNDENS